MFETPTQPQILIAGASGYIGKQLLAELLRKFPGAEITALSRSEQSSVDPRIKWKACDLFSLRSLEDALPANVDLAYYLVHSMGPTAGMDQGSFADYDLILADNFAKALAKKNIKHLIYLGGLVPNDRDLSLHLQSRLEVEECFAQYQLPLTVFRAGLIFGPDGSSSQILLKLVDRLPLMLCPHWTQTLTTPVDLPTVLHALAEAPFNKAHIGKVYDLAGCKPLTYLQMMKETAKFLGKSRFFFPLPFFTPTLSRLWVSLITNSPKDLVYPLVESLEHAMVARVDHAFSPEWQVRGFAQMIGDARLEKTLRKTHFSFRPRRRTVRSVQRLPLPAGRDALWVKESYASWVAGAFSPLLRVSNIDGQLCFYVGPSKIKLLELQLSSERSTPDRQLLYIVGGLLTSRRNRGRLEFRVVLNSRFVLAAIHDFTPALPWFIYKYTQALAHLFVMRSFGRWLASERISDTI